VSFEEEASLPSGETATDAMSDMAARREDGVKADCAVADVAERRQAIAAAGAIARGRALWVLWGLDEGEDGSDEEGSGERIGEDTLENGTNDLRESGHSAEPSNNTNDTSMQAHRKTNGNEDARVRE
jgi:hypothetical protein